MWDTNLHLFCKYKKEVTLTLHGFTRHVYRHTSLQNLMRNADAGARALWLAISAVHSAHYSGDQMLQLRTALVLHERPVMMGLTTPQQRYWNCLIIRESFPNPNGWDQEWCKVVSGWLRNDPFFLSQHSNRSLFTRDGPRSGMELRN